jgi:hypothetical protein
LAKGEKEADAARWKLLFYRHLLQVNDPRLQEARGEVLAWQGLLTEQMLRTSFWVEALGEVATAMAEAAERTASIHANQAFATWLQDGAAGGLKRQHLLTRTATGWIPTKVASEEANVGVEPEELDGLSPAQLDEVTRMPDGWATPLCAQQLANAERLAWGKEWAANEERIEPGWDGVDAEVPPQLQLAKFKAALATFPCGTGLGWDDCHPRALLRLPDEILEAIIELLRRCEIEGNWPLAVRLVVVVLLPKPDGGFRPIGLLPLLPRIWMRARRDAAQEWERNNARCYLYAGEAKGGNGGGVEAGCQGGACHCIGDQLRAGAPGLGEGL